jgi:hypothetical protein
MKNRPERIISFLVVWLTMFSYGVAWGQNHYSIGLEKDFSRVSLPGTKPLQMTSNPARIRGLDINRGVFARSIDSERLYTVPSNIYFIQSGVFCKMEWEIEKASRIPFRFRLGSLADCNALEGKH